MKFYHHHQVMRRFIARLLFPFWVIWLCLLPMTAKAEPLFANSVVSNDLEFIQTDDESVFSCIAYWGKRRDEMPGNADAPLMVDDVHIFLARYKDGTSVGIWGHPDLGTREEALAFVEPVAQAVGKLPTLMRRKLNRVTINKGDRVAFAESRGRFFTMTSRNIKKRISTHDLEETIFHESVHATLDLPHSKSEAWQKAATQDGDFITRYAARKPQKEDLAESALFAFAMIRHPGRLPADIEAAVREIMPHRLAFFEALFTAKPHFYRSGFAQGC